MTDNRLEAPTRLVGTVKWFQPEKGWGFILSATGEDVFIHWKHLPPAEDGWRTLEAGQVVSYVVVPGPDGRLRAEQVQQVDP